jgi:hypothetical protein
MCIYQPIQLDRVIPLTYEVRFEINPALEFTNFSLDFEIFDRCGRLIKTLPFTIGTISSITNLDVELGTLFGQYGIMNYKVKSHHLNGINPVSIVLAYGNIYKSDSNTFEDFY